MFECGVISLLNGEKDEVENKKKFKMLVDRYLSQAFNWIENESAKV